ncbi:MAG: hypothetical protein KIT22_18160, partial [Verrucomicrobiae bacterium]|nr:hypothetical protein [Verrucomicrobiae bacterium]
MPRLTQAVFNLMPAKLVALYRHLTGLENPRFFTGLAGCADRSDASLLGYKDAQLIRHSFVSNASPPDPQGMQPSMKTEYVIKIAVLVITGWLTAPSALLGSTEIEYQFVRLSLTNSAGDSANKINNRGMITGTADGTDGVSRGYLYFDGRERERSGWSGSKFTEWEDINASGDLAGYYADPADATGNTYRAFLRHADSTVIPIGWSGDTNFNFTVEINDAGQVAGGSSLVGWVRNPDDTYIVFKTPGYQTSGAFGINNAGISVGVAFNGFFNKANGLIYDTKADSFLIWNYPGAENT